MSVKKSEKLVPISVLAVYSVLLYAAWTVYHFFVLPQIERLPGELLPALLNDGLCKNLVWTLPAALLIKKFADRLEVKPSEFLSWKREYLIYLLIFPAFVGYILLGMFVHKTPVSFSIAADEVVTVVFVGVTEELVFRAWLLNATMKYAKKPRSDDDIPWQQYAVIAVNAVMFLAVHFPRWITEGVFVSNMAQLGFVSIIILSVIFSLVFLKTKNIVLVIALHMFWDLLIYLFN